MTQILDAALAYSRAGLSIIPTNKDKRPALLTWERCQHERATDATIRKWFVNGANVAIIGGAVSGGLCVLDFDEPQLYFRFKKQTWEISKTLPQEKSGRGFHVFFRCDHPGGNEKIAPQIDKKASGGYVIVAPSIHSSGAQYEIIEGDLCAIPTIPQADADELLRVAREIGNASRNKSAYVEAVLTDELDTLARATEGGRNDALNKAAFALGQFVGAGALDRAEVETVLHHTAIQIGLNAKETLATIGSGLDAGAREPRAIPESNPPVIISNVKDDSTTWLPVRDVMSAFGRGETGDAEIFARLFDNKVCYDHSEKSWYLFGGHSWERDAKNSIGGLVSNEVAAQYLFTAAAKKRKGGEQADELVEKLQARAGSLRFKSKIVNVLSLASTQKQIALSGGEWDADSMLLAVSNGVINLKTGELNPGNPQDYIRTVVSTEWKRLDEPCARWEKFLSEIFAGDAEIVSFVRRWFGYCLTGDVSENSFVVLFGESGRNGKRILTETISQVLGAYAMAGDDDILLDGKDRAAGAPKQYLVDLAKRRMILLSETKEGSRFHLARLKALSGGDNISARAAFGTRGQQIAPTWKIILQTNRMPHADPDDAAFFERIFIVPFTQRFVVNPDPHDPNEHPRDTKLEFNLRGESSGILAWLVRGCLEWQAVGLNVPESIRNATEVYREGEDLVKQFIDEKCVKNPNAQVKAGELYDAYQKWCIAGNLSPMNTTAFGKRMGKRFKKRKSAGVVYSGIGLLQA